MQNDDKTVKSRYYKKRFVRILDLKVRAFGTRNWPISFLHFIRFPVPRDHLYIKLR